MNMDLFVANPSPKGYSWTLASRLGHLLGLAEARYGERDLSYTPLGIEFSSDGPQLWYPGNCQHVIIQLSLDCLAEPERALYQLAHECVHLLSPVERSDATVLEEGLATHFAGWYMREHIGVSYHPAMRSYLNAQEAVVSLLEVEPDAIRTLRKREPTLSKITEDAILTLCPSVKLETAHALAAPFAREV